MTLRPEHPRVARARVAVYGLFVSFGILLSTWAVHLPSLKNTVGMSTSTMGLMLLVVGVGSLVGMQIIGILIDRSGGEPVAVIGGAAMALALSVPLAAHTVSQAMLGALLFGVTTGAADVAMNAAAVNVQRDWHRPIMASFHGTFSVGTVIGSLLAAGGFAIHLSNTVVVGAIATACLVIVGASAIGFRDRYRTGQQQQPPDGASPDPAPIGWRHRRRVLILGALSFLLFLSEGTAMEWGSLHAQEQLGAAPSVGAITVGAFLAAMTLSRLTIDRVTDRIGADRVLRYGSLTAAVAMLIVIVSESIPLVVCGWIAYGLGLAVGVPQVFTAAGNLTSARSGRTLSRVVGLGYVAILAGPALTGWLIEFVSWTGAFLIPVLALMMCAVSAKAVAAEPEPSTT